MADASDRIKEHRERKERLEDAAADARAILSERRAHLDDVKTISAYAKDMRVFLNESELTERRAFIESFVEEIIVMPGDALMRYTVPMPDDSLIPGRATFLVALNGSVLSTMHVGGRLGMSTRACYPHPRPISLAALIFRRETCTWQMRPTQASGLWQSARKGSAS